MIEAPPAFFEIQLITFIVTIGLKRGGDNGVIRYIGTCNYLTTNSLAMHRGGAVAPRPVTPEGTVVKMGRALEFGVFLGLTRVEIMEI